MSVHVCKCTYNGIEEYHLRYPGMSQEGAQRLADKINAGWTAERDALKAALEVAFDYAMQNISEERQRFAGYKPERHAQWAKDEALMRAALAAKGE